MSGKAKDMDAIRARKRASKTACAICLRKIAGQPRVYGGKLVCPHHHLAKEKPK